MTHLWVRAEQRPNECRVGLTPEGAAALRAAGMRVTIEESATRAIGIEGYRAAGCEIAAEGSWPLGVVPTASVPPQDGRLYILPQHGGDLQAPR